MQSLKAIGWGLIGIGVVWLGVMLLFVLAGLHAGKVDAPAALLGIGVFGGVPAAILAVGGIIVLHRARLHAQEMVGVHLREDILERVLSRGRCRFDDLARELQVRPATIESGIYDLVGLRLFTGYINWRGREIISAEAHQISGDKCPNCGGHLELAGKGVSRCAYCGTETYLPLTAPPPLTTATADITASEDEPEDSGETELPTDENQ